MKKIMVKICPKCKSIQINFGKKDVRHGLGVTSWTPDKRVYECRHCGQAFDVSSVAFKENEVPDDTTLCPYCDGYKWDFSNSRLGDVTLVRCSHCGTSMTRSERLKIP